MFPTVVLASPASPRAAFLSASGEVEVISPGGQRLYPVDDSCSPGPMSAVAIGLQCEMAAGPIATLDLSTGALQRYADGTSGGAGIARIGGKWLAATVVNPGGDTIHVETHTVLINLQTRRSISLSPDPFGARYAIALSRATPKTRICRGLKRSKANDVSDRDTYFDGQMLGRSFFARLTLQGFQVTSCHTGHTRTFLGTVPLGRGYALVRHDTSATLLDLASGHRWTIRWPGGSYVYSVALSATDAWMGLTDGRIMSAKLPQR